MREVGLEKGNIRVSSIQNVGKEDSILVLKSFKGYGSHIKVFNSTLVELEMPPYSVIGILNHSSIHSLLYSTNVYQVSMLCQYARSWDMQ